MQDYVRTRKRMWPYSALAKLDAKLESAPTNTTLLTDRARLLRKLGDQPASQRDEDETLRLLDVALAKDTANEMASCDLATLNFNAGLWRRRLGTLPVVWTLHPAIMNCCG